MGTKQPHGAKAHLRTVGRGEVLPGVAASDIVVKILAGGPTAGRASAASPLPRPEGHARAGLTAVAAARQRAVARTVGAVQSAQRPLQWPKCRLPGGYPVRVQISPNQAYRDTISRRKDRASDPVIGREQRCNAVIIGYVPDALVT
jgi:hypothetical protein